GHSAVDDADIEIVRSDLTNLAVAEAEDFCHWHTDRRIAGQQHVQNADGMVLTHGDVMHFESRHLQSAEYTSEHFTQCATAAIHARIGQLRRFGHEEVLREQLLHAPPI